MSIEIKALFVSKKDVEKERDERGLRLLLNQKNRAK